MIVIMWRRRPDDDGTNIRAPPHRTPVAVATQASEAVNERTRERGSLASLTCVWSGEPLTFIISR